MTIGTAENPLNFLLVEDNPGDARLTEETIKDSDFVANVTLVEDGEAALAYLRREGEYSETYRPNLILLDLNLPKKDGMEVLADINTDPDLQEIPVVILTGTQAEASLVESYGISANRFLKKPVEPERLRNVVRFMRSFGKFPPIGPTSSPAPAGGRRTEEKKKWWWPF